MHWVSSATLLYPFKLFVPDAAAALRTAANMVAVQDKARDLVHILFIQFSTLEMQNYLQCIVLFDLYVTRTMHDFYLVVVVRSRQVSDLLYSS